MSNNFAIDYYKNLLLSMRVSKSHGIINIAKPVLFIAIIQCVEEGKILGNHIVLNLTLESVYRENHKNLSDSKITTIIYPFYYMHGEPFYNLKGRTDRKTPSAKFLRENVEYAYLDDQLWELLQDKEVRDEYRRAIIKHFIEQK